MRLVVHPKDILPKIVSWSDIQRQYDCYRMFGRVIQPARFLEIGVAAGYSSYAILSGCEEAGVIPSVTWIDYCDGHGVDGNHNYALGLIRGRFGIDPDDRIINSRDVWSLEHHYDLIHVDGDHSYEGCLHDGKVAVRHLRPNGCVIFHDTDDTNVFRAVDCLVGDKREFHVLNFPQVRCGVRVVYHRDDEIADKLWRAMSAFKL